jgi:hypothetical protein
MFMKKKAYLVKMEINAKQMLVSILTLFMLVVGIDKAMSEEKRGIIRDISTVILASGQGRLVLAVDTTGNRIPDTHLFFQHPVLSTLSQNIQIFSEIGMIVIFNDDGGQVYPNGITQIDGFNIISIDGDNMIFLFPNERENFKFATQAYDRQR